MKLIQVHPAGTKILIDREKGRIGTTYPNEVLPGQTYDLNSEWVKKYLVCKFCGKPLDDERVAYAYFHLQQGYCSGECYSKQELSHYACCAKATQLGCVCAYAITCPEHGERHWGTHD